MKISLNWHEELTNNLFLDKENCTDYGRFLELLIFILQLSRNLNCLYVKEQENLQDVHRDILAFLVPPKYRLSGSYPFLLRELWQNER
jgi:hypothetical protein